MSGLVALMFVLCMKQINEKVLLVVAQAAWEYIGKPATGTSARRMEASSAAMTVGTYPADAKPASIAPERSKKSRRV